MKKLLSSLFLSLSLAFLPVAPSYGLEKVPHTVVITEDMGGFLRDYVGRAIQHSLNNTKVVIDGPCWSACTVYLASGNVCATQRAIFYFHHAFDIVAIPGGVMKIPSIHANEQMQSLYPKKIQDWIKDRGGLPLHGWLAIQPVDFKHFGIKRCA